MQLEDHLDDLCVRFIVNIPAEELQSPERICFMIEEAQWFYEDFIRPQDPSLPSLTLKPFFSRIIQRCPILEHWTPDQATRAFEEFLAYKQRVPVRGAILLNPEMNEVVLVKGYKKGGNWTFPRGKINENEDDLDCAMREAYEETGLDIRAAGLVKHRSAVRDIELTMRGQNIRLFVFPGVSKDTPFAPQTRKEIGKIQWYKLSDLPTLKKNKAQQEGTGQHLVINANKFYMVAPFVGPLKRIIKEERKRQHRPTSSHLAAPPIVLEDLPSEDEQRHFFDYAQPSHGPLSPQIPSNLPEVATAAPLDPLASLKSQLNIPFQSSQVHVQNADMQKSNALLALLKGPATEMRTDPHTPSEQINFPRRPSSPERINRPVAAAINPQSPPPTFDPLHQVQPSGPPASALPQLNPHAQSLLEAFSRPVPQAEKKPTKQLSPAQAGLLAAFNTKTTSPPPTNPAANTLLGLLQRAPPSSQASSLLTKPQSIEVSQQSTAAAPKPALDAASLMQSLTRRPLNPTLHEPSPSTRTETQHKPPAELSALPSEPTEAVPSKQNLLALLGKPSLQPAPKPVPTLKEGQTAARLSAPLNHPNFDAVPQASLADRVRDQRRAPVTGEKKLYDHKQDEFTGIQQRIKENPKLPRSPKSPRSIRSKHNHSSSPKRPGTPKDMSKPFQPQILKRPQTSDSNAAFETNRQLDLPHPSESQPRSSQPGLIDLSSLIASSSVADDSQAKPTSSNPPVKAVSDVPKAAPKPIAAVDPHKAELLSLLKSPSLATAPKPLAVDPDATPKGHFASIPAPGTTSAASVSPAANPEAFPGRLSPITTSQIISPIVDGEMDPLSTRSRVSSLASGAGNAATPSRPHLEKRQTTASDKLFLMDYLKGIAQQAS